MVKRTFTALMAVRQRRFVVARASRQCPWRQNTGETPVRRGHLQRTAAVLLALACSAASAGAATGVFPVYGPFTAVADGAGITLGNDAIVLGWSTVGGHLRPTMLTGSAPIVLTGEPFELQMADGSLVKGSELVATGPAVVRPAVVRPESPKLSDHLAGQTITLVLEDAAHTLRVTWTAVGRDGGNYVREDVSVQPLVATVPLRKIVLFDGPLPTPTLSGPEKGPVVVAGNVFVGIEHPIAHATIKDDVVRCDVDRAIDLSTGQVAEASAVFGVVRPGQLRRDFQSYVERERAHPYRPFLHYNTWYDLGEFNRYSSDDLVATINTFGTELTTKRGVVLSSFLLDDGWDDPMTLWNFNPKFPAQLGPARDAAAKYGAAPGMWLSPWGGYAKPHAQRLAAATTQGYEHNAGGPILSGPKYYAHFRDVCLDLIKTGGVNQFKFDGTGNASAWFPGSKFGSDFEAAISLIGELRAAKPDLFVNLTTGTWPSPFWTAYADSIWRGGEDHSFAGVGTWRQKWITYRDSDTYTEIAAASPLYPLNSLMLHGMIYAARAHHLKDDPGHDFPSEVRSYFGTGTQLQEMYITPKLLTPADWDVLAEGANWSRANAATLVDTHWVGGDPAKLEVYGWAAWSPAKGILTLRNPSDKPQTIAVDVAKVFELPPGAATQFTAKSPWKDQQARPAIDLAGGTPHELSLQPFEVLTLEATPAK
jgi:hypothetical protein